MGNLYMKSKSSLERFRRAFQSFENNYIVLKIMKVKSVQMIIFFCKASSIQRQESVPLLLPFHVRKSDPDTCRLLR